MAYPTYLVLKGKSQGLISAGCSSQDSIGNRYQVGHEDEIQIIGLNSGSFREQNASYKPVVFTKPIDKSSPLLSVALDSNEVLEAKFMFYRTSQAGQLERYYEIKLTGVSLIEISDIFPDSIKDNESMPYQRVQMKYESISRSHLMANTSSYSINSEMVK
ncbi:Hcp family type VI secretion system effector [Providencia hangzhouensis]|uniref:Hcp family type VI secretion system effector n=1 Tax=Providencia rettgeri TaxID=587 RepID=A0A2A5Q4G6_PRORE|nr:MULTISPECIES: Hcp family type VI secretion system effector [Providencia]MBG5927649.1 Hcp family type VI secretion system effector [Providencia rettgeri]MBI6190156.1 Hcp family type VI secretion system effector [Providencia rettgeri]MBN6366798.1 Hcp family type VI secretion system effector [Providencia rettgeri]MBQ0266489.1 Hcp family type VI secretion system effector [Providencia rettgeri]MBQ0372616.1 Hcp family type VI secretion system effector [Providencia rettgeri]